MKARFALAVFALTALAAHEARAEDAGASDATALANDVEVAFGHVGEQLATHACDEACRALTSMRRAAEKLCALEPGPRCDHARARCREAAMQVRDACPDCATATAPPVHEQAAAPPEVQHVTTEERRGGCASCATAKSTDVSGDLTVLALALLGLATIKRRAKLPSRGGSALRRPEA